MLEADLHHMPNDRNTQEGKCVGEITSDLILDMYEKIQNLPEDQKAEALENVKLLSKNIGKFLVKS